MKLKEQNRNDLISYYLGTWRNSYEKARLIGEFTIFEANDGLRISVKNSRESFYTGPWQEVPIRPHAYAPEMNDIVAFQAHFEMDEMNAFFAMNENKGLLIIAGYLTFSPEDPRADCFVREFFYKV